LSAKEKKSRKKKSVDVADKDSAEDFDITPEKKKKKKVSKLLRAKLSDSSDDDDNASSKKKKNRKASEHCEETGSDDDSDVVRMCVLFLLVILSISTVHLKCMGQNREHTNSPPVQSESGYLITGNQS